MTMAPEFRVLAGDPSSANGRPAPQLTPEVRAQLADLPVLRFLPEAVRERVIDSFEPVSFTFGMPIVREGEPADALYVVLSGRARVVKNAARDGTTNGELSLGVLKAGDTFGEIGLLEQSVRTLTVRASGDVETLRLDRSVFDVLLAQRPELRRYFEQQVAHQRLSNFFKEFTAFARLPATALGELLDDLDRTTVPAGTLVIREGDPSGPMYIVEEGRLRVFVEENGRRKYIAYYRKGDFFGELSIFKGAPRAASVEAVSDCTLSSLRQETFGRLLATYPEFRARIEERIAQYDYKNVARVPLDFAEESLPAQLRASVQVSADQLDVLTTPRPASASGAPEPAREPFESEDGHFKKKGKRIRRFPLVYQIDEMDCGAACLAMVCRHYGRAVSLARIRQLVHTSLDGTSLRALCQAASELGLAARSVKASPRNFDRMPLPAIIHWEGNHWVVLYDVSATHAWLVDPAFGHVKVTREELLEKWTGYSALFDYTEAFEKAPVSKAGLAWLWPFLKPHMPLVLKSVALAGIVSALQMVLPVFTQIIVDRVVVDQDRALLGLLIVGMLGVLVFMTLATLVQRYLMSFAAVRIDSATLDHLTRRLLALPMSYFATRRTGDIQRRLEGMKHVREFLVQQGVGALSAMVQLAATLTMMAIYSPKLMLVFLATVPLYGALMYYSARFLRPLLDKLEDAYGKYHSHQIDAIKGIETVKSMAAEGTFRELMLGQFNAVSRRRFNADFTMMSYDGVVQMVTFLSVVLFLFVGARLVMDGQLTIGGLVAFNSLVALANAPIVNLLSTWDGLQVAQLLLNRLNDVFEPEPEQGNDRSALVPVRSLEGRVSFQNMGFRYGGSESAPILDGITLDVPAGKMVAIIGRSGSGKTTLIKCLAGLLEPTEGTIRYDGVELKTLNYRDLRRQVGFVLQENYLFNDTIARNIAFGDNEPDMDTVIWASRVANAHEFVERLPLGYETKVGESGLAISGGQRQRVAIARAVYHRPPILVFDEATSALDTESERAVKDNLAQLLAGRTSFVIAHRLSTVRDADLIVVLEKGRLAEQGTHEELMKHQGLYYYLVSQQLTT
jgi:ATP-binding cassette subfamily B protein